MFLETIFSRTLYDMLKNISSEFSHLSITGMLHVPEVKPPEDAVTVLMFNIDIYSLVTFNTSSRILYFST